METSPHEHGPRPTSWFTVAGSYLRSRELPKFEFRVTVGLLRLVPKINRALSHTFVLGHFTTITAASIAVTAVALSIGPATDVLRWIYFFLRPHPLAS